MHDNTIELGQTVDAAIAEMQEARRKRENRQITWTAVLFILLGAVGAVVFLAVLPGLMSY